MFAGWRLEKWTYSSSVFFSGTSSRTGAAPGRQKAGGPARGLESSSPGPVIEARESQRPGCTVVGRAESRATPAARLIGVLFIGVVLLATRPLPVAAQSGLQMWLNPEMGKQMPRADYRLTFYPERAVEHQEAHFGWMEHRVSLFAPLYQDSKDEVALAVRGRFEDIETSAHFPDTGGRFPDQLWDVNAGLSYRHKFDNSWTAGVALTVGSASDKPFDSWDEMYIRFASMLRVPQGERNSWIFTLIYATDETIFGENLPIPGVAYAWVPSDKLRVVVGFPFSMIEFKPVEKLTFDAEYYPFWTVRTRATWEIFRPLRAYVGWQWDSDHYYRSDRLEKPDKLFYREMRAYAGVRFDLRHIGFEVTGGYAFNRFWFEGEGYSDRNDNRIDLGDSWLIVGKVNLRF